MKVSVLVPFVVALFATEGALATLQAADVYNSHHRNVARSFPHAVVEERADAPSHLKERAESLQKKVRCDDSSSSSQPAEYLATESATPSDPVVWVTKTVTAGWETTESAGSSWSLPSNWPHHHHHSNTGTQTIPAQTASSSEAPSFPTATSSAAPIDSNTNTCQCAPTGTASSSAPASPPTSVSVSVSESAPAPTETGFPTSSEAPQTYHHPTSTHVAPPPKKTSSLLPKTQTKSTPSATASAPLGTATQEAINTYLQVHNDLRAKHDATPVTWNATLGAAAQTWSSKCVFEHSGGKLGPYGENLAAYTGSSINVTEALDMWAAEEPQYNPADPQYSHYTQMVWKGTHQIGCAVAVCAPGSVFDASYGNSLMFTCEYYPQGNVIGEFASNVS